MKMFIHPERAIIITDVNDEGRKLGYLWIGDRNNCYGYIDGAQLKVLEKYFIARYRNRLRKRKK